jgi:hypothetical protein
VATIAITGTDHKTFVPVSAALTNLAGGPGTIIVLAKVSTAGQKDFVGVTDPGDANFYHGLGSGAITASHLFDDTNTGSVEAPATWGDSDTTNWQWVAVDWPGSAATETFHWRNHTTGGAWTHSVSAAAYGGLKTAPATAWLRIGYMGDGSTGSHLIALVAIWAGTRFANTDYATWTKTSDLYNHALGHPTFLCELTATTPVDLIGGSTYSSGNSSGTALTGANPDNWTFDQLGAGISGQGSASAPGRLGMFTPQMRSDAWF